MTVSDVLNEGVKTSDVLEAAANLLEKPGAWTQGVFARNAKGVVVGFRDDSATCFCAAGAIYRSAKSNALGDPAINLLNTWARRRHFEHLAKWNDAPERTQAEVVAALRQAARQSKGAE